MQATIVKESEQGFDRIDRDAGVIYGVKVLGLVSKNGRRYQESAVRKAASMYEGAVVNIDHDVQDGETFKDRPIGDRWGVLRNVVFREGALYADLHYIKAHPMTPQLVEAAERFSDTFGLSHDASGDERVIDGERQVVEIYRVNSVDVVSKPATNDGLFESLRNTASETCVKTANVADRKKVTRRKVQVQKQESYRGDPMAQKTYSQIVESSKAFRDLLEGAMGGYSDMQDKMIQFDEGSNGSNGQVGAAFRAAMLRVLDDDSMDTQGKLGKLKAIMVAKDKAMQAMSDAGIGDDSGASLPGDAEAAPDSSMMGMGAGPDDLEEEMGSMNGEDEMSPEDDAEDAMEAKKKDMEESCGCKNCQKESAKVAKLQQEVSMLECKALLLESKCDVSDVKIKALLPLNASERKSLVESWSIQGRYGQRPAKSPSVFSESASGSYPKNQSEFLRVLR
jgi:hypothetical protein